MNLFQSKEKNNCQPASFSRIIIIVYFLEVSLRDYEVIVIVDSNQTENTTGKDEIEAILKKRKAEVVHNEDWGKRKLFHPPKGTSHGVFHYFKMKSDPAAIAQINADLKVNQSVLKSMVSVV